MKTKTAMLGLLAETSIHPGTGRSMGVVDLPVAREAATDYPVIVGSSLKGALKDKAEAQKVDNSERERLFGAPNQAGSFLVSDARLLLLPVRSLTASFRWATSRHLIERYRRDCGRAGLEPLPEVPQVDQGSVLTAGNGEPLFLEERQFAIVGEPDPSLIEAMAQLVLHNETRGSLKDRLVVLNDNDFAWFARYGLLIQARNKLEKGTKKSENLWYEETLPPDTIMYALVSDRNGEALHALDALFPPDDPYLQTGGNETIGQGWFAVKILRSDIGGVS